MNPAPTKSISPTSAVALHCPLCEYNVHGLTEPRCPECGHRFEWEELTDPNRRKLPWFFEHRRGLRGYAATQWQLLRPRRFWRTLRPSHRVHAGRLWLFLLLSLGSALGSALVTYAAIQVSLLHFESLSLRAQLSAPLPTKRYAAGWLPAPSLASLPPNPTYADLYAASAGLSVSKFLDRQFPLISSPQFFQRLTSRLRLHDFRTYAGNVLAMMAPPLAGTAVLLVMRQTFSRVKMLRGHALRVALYSSDLTALTLLFLLSCAGLGITLLTGPGNIPWVPGGRGNSGVGVIVTFYLLWLYRFHAGIRFYLNLPRPALIAFAAATVAGLSGYLAYLWTAVIHNY